MNDTTMLPPDAVPHYDVPATVPAKAKKPRPKSKLKVLPVATNVPEVNRFKFNLTIALGVFIPVMSLAASKIAGTLAAHEHYTLATFGAGIGVAVLAVSLSHLAWAIHDVTGSGPKASWALAIALDCSLVMCELVHVTATPVGINGVCWMVMVVVAAFSMVLNCHAFLNHKVK